MSRGWEWAGLGEEGVRRGDLNTVEDGRSKSPVFEILLEVIESMKSDRRLGQTR